MKKALGTYLYLYFLLPLMVCVLLQLGENEREKPTPVDTDDLHTVIENDSIYFYHSDSLILVQPVEENS